MKLAEREGFEPTFREQAFKMVQIKGFSLC